MGRISKSKKKLQMQMKIIKNQNNQDTLVNLPTGRRLITIDSLNLLMKLSMQHTKTCENPDLHVVSEYRKGMNSKLTIKCLDCKVHFTFETDTGIMSLPVNKAAVWASNCTGCGYTVLQHAFATLDVPFISNYSYYKIEEEFSGEVEAVTNKILKRNGEEELKLAMDLNRQDPDSMFWTEVECDGAWARRSYNNRGLSLSETAVIIGCLTQKPLFIATKNKFCIICCKSKDKEIKRVHKCYKNFEGPSTNMESSIIKEGFESSIEMHGLRYKRFIGDGDSNVFFAVKHVYYDKVNDYKLVEKIECKNHILRRMNTKLRECLLQTIYPKSERNILDYHLNSFGKSCAYAIQQNKEKYVDIVKGACFLKADLLNVVSHVFGNHNNCSSTFCSGGKLIRPKSFKSATTIEKTQASDQEAESIMKSVDPSTNQPPRLPINSKLLERINEIIEYVAKDSKSLIQDKTTNMSESFNATVSKFTQGKRINYTSRGAYTRKCQQAVISKSSGDKIWTYNMYKLQHGKSPLSTWKITKKLNQKKEIKRRERKITRKPNKPEFFSVSRNFMDSSYGENHNEPDISESDLKAGIEKKLHEKSVNSVQDQWSINLETRGQFDSECYRTHRKYMITASFVGDVYGLRDATSNVRILDRIMEPKYLATIEILWGKENESKAVKCYELHNNNEIKVKRSGLFVSLECGFLGASPDGLIGEDGLLEAKCPYKERYSLPEMVGKRKVSYLESVVVNNESKFQLKRSSHYYLQVVMQLNITNRVWCDFIIWTQGESKLDSEGMDKFVNPNGHLFIERIYRKDTTMKWEEMLTKLVRFVKDDLLPELVDSRYIRMLGYRQPDYRLNAIREKQNKIKEKELEKSKEQTCKLDSDLEAPTKKSKK